jgi:flagellar basal-body rod modification protein FlgD
MSAVDAIAPSSGTTATSGTGFSALSADDFSKIIFTELSKQDPLQPNDTNALLQQISTVRGIQSDMDLTTKLSSLVNQNEFASATSLIGKTVSGVDVTNQRVSGTVTAVSRTSDGTYVTLSGGQFVSIANIDQIQEPAPAPTDPTTPPLAHDAPERIPHGADHS